MTTVEKQQQQQLTPEELAIANYFADAECERKRPRNHDAYRATIFARKASELIETRNFRDPIARIVAEQLGELDDGPVVEYVAPIDPLIAAHAWAQGIEQGRAERRALLAKMEAEQGRDAKWR